MSGYASVSSYGAVAAEAEVLFDSSQPISKSGDNAKHHELLITTSPDYVAPRPKFRDVSFGLAFILHLVAVLYVYSGAGVSEQDNAYPVLEETIGISVLVCLILCLSTIALSIFQFHLIRANSLFLVHTCMCGYVIVSLAAGISMVLSGELFIALLGILQFIGVAWYIRLAWPFAPFSAANLLTATHAVLDNLGISIVGIVLSILSIIWTYVWLVVVSTVQNRNCSENTDENQDVQCANVSNIYYFLLFCSFFWTILVLTYTIQCTVAGVVGTWWTYPQGSQSCFSSAVVDSLFRSLTYSFGSICKGALVLAIVKALRAVADQVREEERRSGDRDLAGSILLCILSCLLNLLEDIIEYANQWAFVYVGLYGFSYVEAGREVINLFKAKGWSTIITNDITTYVTFFSIIFIGFLNGIVALLFNCVGWSIYADFSNIMNFGVGMAIGIIISSSMFTLLSGAVNTTIVCFAEMPADLDMNHPALSEIMRTEWLNKFPSCGLPVAVHV